MSAADDTSRAGGREAAVPPSVVGYILLGTFLLTYPAYASDFFLFQVAAYAMILGIIALSLTFLAGYGGMVSLAQMTIAGLAGYLVAIFGATSATEFGLGWPWWLVVPLAIGLATLASALIGAISVRTEGIYTIMITLAIAVAFFYFTRQNYDLFNGFNGFAGIAPPMLFGVDWRTPLPFYYLTLGVSVAAYVFVLYISRSTFGLSLQAVRDNARRMEALGFNVTGHRIFAWVIAGAIAGVGGVLAVWFNGRISPGTISVGPVIDILVIAVIGGLRRPIGPFLGAIVFVLLENFAIDLIDRERFNTVIGLSFLAIVLFSPDGLLGLWDRLKGRLAQTRPPLS
ncbi:branched-chain amino acid ABC transporter permease [Marivibrio halodurans]|uniref:Branched-chain amino acid ABC transporter permease n=1 Tax=Marivibrio halodurans TaxID=2039722 RepID=A0A8J7S157_9PROT|nr:branched-chain amino acid ABC transporter permease [Marivibrio halodurans]MBP5858350.1 branched-chain amino acid ABC transporter permease [Marivibrio halodurans]